MTLEHVLSLAQQLRPVDQVRLIARLVPKVERALDAAASVTPGLARKPLRRLLADLGSAPSAEEIDEVQNEMRATFAEE
ncbi:MAG: hypothetical protein H6641_18775 [Caldilineaceae bacterium]|nr:hypothetical protein [Caldilineaceae bacterium]